MPRSDNDPSPAELLRRIGGPRKPGPKPWVATNVTSKDQAKLRVLYTRHAVSLAGLVDAIEALGYTRPSVRSVRTWVTIEGLVKGADKRA